MKKLVLAVLGGTAVASLAFASAATLSIDGGVVQTGVTTNGLSCDSNGVKINWGLETDDSLVYHANITDIADACDGADIVLRTNLMDVKEKYAGVIDGNSHMFRFDEPQDAAALTSARVWIGR